MPPPEPLPTPAPPAAPASQQPAWQAPPQPAAMQPVAPQPYYSNAYPAAYYAAPPRRPRTLGVVAFIAGLVVTIASPIVSGVAGASLGGLVAPGGGFAAGFAAGANSDDPQTAIAGLVIIAQLYFGSGLGIWALVQGIIAVRSHRGRGWGAAAIVLAGVAPILSFIVYIAAIAATQSAG